MIAAAEARGFIFGAPLALAVGSRLRADPQAGQASYATIAQEYQLEYGSDKLEVHSDALWAGPSRAPARRRPGHRRARCRPAATWSSRPAPGRCLAFVIELSFLGGRAKLEPGEIFSLITY